MHILGRHLSKKTNEPFAQIGDYPYSMGLNVLLTTDYTYPTTYLFRSIDYTHIPQNIDITSKYTQYIHGIAEIIYPHQEIKHPTEQPQYGSSVVNQTG